LIYKEDIESHILLTTSYLRLIFYLLFLFNLLLFFSSIVRLPKHSIVKKNKYMSKQFSIKRIAAQHTKLLLLPITAVLIISSLLFSVGYSPKSRVLAADEPSEVPTTECSFEDFLSGPAVTDSEEASPVVDESCLAQILALLLTGQMGEGGMDPDLLQCLDFLSILLGGLGGQPTPTPTVVSTVTVSPTPTQVAVYAEMTELPEVVTPGLLEELGNLNFLDLPACGGLDDFQDLTFSTVCLEKNKYQVTVTNPNDLDVAYSWKLLPDNTNGTGEVEGSTNTNVVVTTATSGSTVKVKYSLGDVKKSTVLTLDPATCPSVPTPTVVVTTTPAGQVQGVQTVIMRLPTTSSDANETH
jgi:hypothetical protein